MIHVDPTTGEVLEPAEAQALADSLALEIVPLEEAIDQARAEVQALVHRREALVYKLRPLLGETGRADGGAAWVVAVPPVRGAQRVSAAGCALWKEQLLTLGLGYEEKVYRPPKITEVRAARATLIAAGVELEDIAPEPHPGPPAVEVVPKEGLR